VQQIAEPIQTKRDRLKALIWRGTRHNRPNGGWRRRTSSWSDAWRKTSLGNNQLRVICERIFIAAATPWVFPSLLKNNSLVTEHHMVKSSTRVCSFTSGSRP